MWHEDVRGATEPADQTAFPFNLLAMPMVDEVRMKATDSLFDVSMAREHLCRTPLENTSGSWQARAQELSFLGFRHVVI